MSTSGLTTPPSVGNSIRKDEQNLSVPVTGTGTKITVARLNPSAAVSFAQPHFCNSLGREIEYAQQEYINRGLGIVYRGRSLIRRPVASDFGCRLNTVGRGIRNQRDRPFSLHQDFCWPGGIRSGSRWMVHLLQRKNDRRSRSISYNWLEYARRHGGCRDPKIPQPVCSLSRLRVYRL